MTTPAPWPLFKGMVTDATGTYPAPPHDGIERLLELDPPPWRAFASAATDGELLDDHPPDEGRDAARGRTICVTDAAAEMVNAALYLRRPLLVTGAPGSGKSSLAYAVAYQLQLGPVLRWPITTRTTLAEGLYRYDAVARLQQATLAAQADIPIGTYLQLGPLGTALLPRRRPRVLLIDEIDKSDLDLPNDLLTIFEEGDFEIPELARRMDVERISQVRPWDSRDPTQTVPIDRGRVMCHTFPIVIMTSNGEREFPRAFLRRCLRLDMQPPTADALRRIVEAHLGADAVVAADALIRDFLVQRDEQQRDLATDQVLNAIYLLTRGIDPRNQDKTTLQEGLLRPLTEF